jgi:hypothetical protein
VVVEPLTAAACAAETQNPEKSDQQRGSDSRRPAVVDRPATRRKERKS